MSTSFEPASSLEPLVNSLGRIQSQIQALMEMEKSWRDELSVDQLRELMDRKQQLIDNIQALITEQERLEQELIESSGDPLPPRYKAYRDQQVASIHQMLENIIGLHQTHEQQIRQQAGVIKQNLQEVRQAMAMVNAYHGQKINTARHIDLEG